MAPGFEPVTGDTARRRMLREVLAWGGPRPAVPPGLVDELRARLESGLSPLVPPSEAATRWELTRSQVERSVCDGWLLDPLPFTHTRASVRGVLAHRAVLRDLQGAGSRPAADVVDEVWRDESSRRPGDPASRSWWLNRLPADGADGLRAELVDLVEGVREVWPPLPTTLVEAAVGRTRRVPVSGGRVVLGATPSMVLRSLHDDGRARSLVLDVRTGRPRPEPDLLGLRYHALVETLATGRPPFRWVVLYVTEGRTEVEDLDADVLHGTAGRVVEVVRVLTAAGTADTAARLAAGAWCASCRREPTCAVAAAARPR